MKQSPHELFDEHKHLPTVTLYKMLGQPHNVARSKQLEYSDLLQYANLGLWKACLNYDSKMSKFKSYAVNNMRWEIKNGLNRDSNIFKLNPNDKPDDEDIYNLVGFDNQINASTHLTFEEIVESNHSVEKEIMDKLATENLLLLLSNREAEILLLKSKDKTNVEIAEKFDVTPQAIGNTIRKIQKKLKGYKEEYLYGSGR